MWAIRMLSGQHAGQIFKLGEGRNLVGRGTNCQIQFKDRDVSKEHAIVLLEKQHLTLIDNQSRNGTYVNGVRVNKIPLKKGDKLSFNQTICDVIYLQPAPERKLTPSNLTPQSFHHQIPTIINQARMPTSSHIPSSGGLPHSSTPTVNAGTNALKNDGFFQRYFEEVLLPGVYQLGRVMEFKIVIGLFMLVFAVLVTGLSTIPMVAITSDSIQIESRRRALTIARNLANVNQQALIKEMESALSTQTADLEEGVSLALIVRQGDGSVIAPATKAGSIPALPFIEKARREQKELIQQIDASHIAVAVPLSAFNPEAAAYTLKAFAIVVYDMGSLAVDDGRTLSLFFQTLIIALILGFALYYIFYRFVEHPIAELNKQLDQVLTNKGSTSTAIDLQFPELQNLVSNVNTLLTRVSSQSHSGGEMGFSKDMEAINITRLVGYPCMAISSEQNILAINSAGENLLGISDHQMRNQPITLIPDQALQKSLYDLIEHVSRDPSVPSKNELEFGGENTEITCQALTDKGQIHSYLVTIVSMGGAT